MDVNNDDNLDLIEAEFGLTGWAVVVKLFARIYRSSYFTEWTNDQKLLFSKEINVSINEIDAVINRAIERGLFSRELFESYGILTSTGIQKRYFNVAERRKEFEVVSEFLLIDINEDKKAIYVNINKINSCKNKHIKLNESKPNKIKEKNNGGKPPAHSGNRNDDKTKIASADAISIASIIYKNANKEPKPNELSAGALVIDELHRLDGFSYDEIEKVIKWGIADTGNASWAGWSAQIKSPAGLRKKRNGAGDLTKFEKIYTQWKHRPETHDERMARLEREQEEKNNE